MKLQFAKKIEIEKNIADVFNIISDVKNWNSWSPWFHCEPTCKTESLGVAHTTGQTHTWEGEVIGAGKMTVDQLEANKSVLLKLEFFKPWKGLSWAKFELKELGNNKTEVTWSLDSSLPFFMFFFKNMMIAYMSNDFDRGLKMLKELCETGEVLSKSIYKGETSFGGFFVVGKKINCPISEISVHAKKEFQNLGQMLSENKLTQPEGMVTLSHVHDIPKGVCTFTSGFIYKSNENLKVPVGYEVIQIAKHKGMAIEHLGPYRHIGNAWSMAASYQRGLKKKLSKTVPAYEIYKTMPGAVADKDIQTQITMPLRD